MSSTIMTLDKAPPGGLCRIVRLLTEGAVRRRLLDFGFVPGGDVVVVRQAPLGDPLTIRVGDDTIAVRRKEAARIEVQPHD